MKADMLALKDQRASMVEAMLGMKRLMESNAATAAAASTIAEVDQFSRPRHIIPFQKFWDEGETHWGMPTTSIWGTTKMLTSTVYCPTTHH